MTVTVTTILSTNDSVEWQQMVALLGIGAGGLVIVDVAGKRLISAVAGRWTHRVGDGRLQLTDALAIVPTVPKKPKKPK